MGNILRGSNHQSIKYKNRALVLKIISTQGPMSRIELSRITKLSKMSITNIINELIEKKMVCETENAGVDDNIEPACGRKPVQLDVNPDALYALGIYIARDYCKCTLANLKGEFLQIAKVTFAFDETPDSFVEKVKCGVKKVMNESPVPQNKILGIGIASIGPLDIQNGIILEPPNFHNLHQIHMKEILEKEFGFQVYMDNDMNAAALAEKYYGKGIYIDNFVYLGITNGIGAGIISNNTLYSGDSGFVGEIGHTTIHFEGPKCACGNSGCLELYANIPEVVKQARHAIELGMATSLTSTPDFSWPDIIHHAAQGDGLCLKLIDKLCLYISIGITNLVNTLDPKTVFLGHDIALAGNLVLERISNAVNRRMISSRYKEIKIEISKFIDKAPLIGSVTLVFEKLFTGETSLP